MSSTPKVSLENEQHNQDIVHGHRRMSTSAFYNSRQSVPKMELGNTNPIIK